MGQLNNQIQGLFMKKSYLLSLISVLAISGSCFAMEDEKALLEAYIKEFKTLSDEKKVERIATKAFFDGQLAEDPEIAAAFREHSEKRLELHMLVQELKPEIKRYCWERLDDTVQKFLTRFEARLLERRGSMTCNCQEGHVEVFGVPEDDRALLEKMPAEQGEPLYVYASLLRMDAAEQRPTPTSVAKKKKLARLLQFIGVHA